MASTRRRARQQVRRVLSVLRVTNTLIKKASVQSANWGISKTQTTRQTLNVNHVQQVHPQTQMQTERSRTRRDQLIARSALSVSFNPTRDKNNAYHARPKARLLRAQPSVMGVQAGKKATILSGGAQDARKATGPQPATNRNVMNALGAITAMIR